ncbi:MAG: hypothetical protein HYZ14_12125 [Bacteroidetes bacterium]|nr:hypothetical protein [Bacteroidota bacterium]
MKDRVISNQIWWMDNKMGGYDGYELRPNGELKLLNWDLFTGKSWRREGDKLILEMIYRKNGKQQTTIYTVVSETDNAMQVIENVRSMILETNLLKVYLGNFTDSLLGHWDGENESYLQVIPKSFDRFQLVFSAGPDQEVEKYDAEPDEEKQCLVAEDYEHDTTYEVTCHLKNETTESLFCNGRIYKRPVW